MITSKVLTSLIAIVYFLTIPQSSHCQVTGLTNKTWAYKKIAIVYQQDTLFLFHADSVKNVWYMGRVSLALKENNIYTGTDLNGDEGRGTWSFTDQKIVVDKDTNQIVNIFDKSFTTISPISYSASNSRVEGMLVTTFYAVPKVASTCASLKSGNWSDAQIWSCGREPTSGDIVVLNVGHRVTVSNGNATAQRLIYQGGELLLSGVNSKVLIKGAD